MSRITMYLMVYSDTSPSTRLLAVTCNDAEGIVNATRVYVNLAKVNLETILDLQNVYPVIVESLETGVIAA
jgi:RNase P/RNase MRP subunit POP5